MYTITFTIIFNVHAGNGVDLVLIFFIVMGQVADLISDGSGGRGFSKLDPSRTLVLSSQES